MNPKIIVVAAVIAIAIVGAIVYIELPYRSSPKLQIATTTSLYDTGLLDYIASYYHEHYGTSLFFIPAGTGQAIQHAKMGEADLLLVHAPSSENTFMQTDNLGVVRKIIAYNFFVIVGPAEDSAGIENLAPTAALQKIIQVGNVTWVSRGDGSGTHIKENQLWKKAGFDMLQLRENSWYREAGMGMGATLNMTNEMRAYTLSDIGAYLKYYKDGLINLKILVGEHKDLLNVYSVMAVSPTAYPELNFSGAVDLIKFLVSNEGQNLIGNFGVSNYGQQLFYPAVQLLKENTDPTIASWIRDYAFLSYDNQKLECPPPYRAGQDNLYS
jgi:tungstate transport system substrate-binding protein